MHDGSPQVTLRARYVFGVSAPPQRDGCITLAGPRIVAVGPRTVERGNVLDLGNVAILPGLINAHTHLEFSDLAAPLGHSGITLPEWIPRVIAARRGQAASAVGAGLAESSCGGVTGLGEIATDNATLAELDAAPVDGVVFRESIGLRESLIATRLAEAEDLIKEAARLTHARLGLSPHAPYSVHPKLVAGLVALAAAHNLPVAMHLAESREELELLSTGGGPFRRLLEDLGAWDSSAIPLGSRALDYLRMLSAAPRALVIHGNYLDEEEIRYLAARRERMSLVYCPRTHAYFGHAKYPLARLLEAGVSLAVGTDSRSSNPDLSLLAELRFLAAHHPDVAASQILELGTIGGARALGLEHEVGTLAAGKFANLAVVALPDRDSRDPYELLFDSAEPVVACYYRGRRVTGGSW